MSPKSNMFEGAFNRANRMNTKLDTSGINALNKNTGVKAIHFYNQVTDYGMPASLEHS